MSFSSQSIYLFVALFLFSQMVMGQALFQKNYGALNFEEDMGKATCLSQDGGIIMAGHSNFFGPGGKDVLILKTDEWGDTLISMACGGLQDDEVFGVCKTSDNGFVVTGQTRSFGSGLNDVLVSRFDSLGSEVWSVVWGGSDEDFGTGVVEDGTGNIYVVATTSSFSGGDDDLAIMKINVSGSIQWAKTYSGSSDNSGLAIAIKSNGNILVTGEGGNSSWGAIFLEVDANGGIISSSVIEGANGWMKGNEIKEVTGGFILTGYVTSGGAGGIDAFITKLDASGNVVWSNQFGSSGYEEGYSIIETQDGGFAMVGLTTGFGAGSYDIYIVKVNSSGNLQWSRTYGDASIEEAYDIMEMTNGDLVVGGYIYSQMNWYTGYDFFLMRTDDQGITLGCMLDAPSTVQTSSSDLNVNVVFTISNNGISSNISLTSSYVIPNVENYIIPLFMGQTNVLCDGVCGGTAVADACDQWNVCKGTAPYSFLWDDPMNQTVDSIFGLCEGVYNVSLTDANGCVGMDSVQIVNTALLQDICLISVDSSSNYNLIIWEKPITTSIDSFRIYRNIVGNYTHVGSVDYNDLSQFADSTPGVNPNTTSYRYKMSSIDTCGNESSLSDFHETIHTTSSVGTNGETVLIWDNYEGFNFNYYRILRDSIGLGDYQVLDSVTSNNFTYTDWTALNMSFAAYLVEVIPQNPCTSTRAVSHNSSRSNVTMKISNNSAPSAGFNALQNNITQGESVDFYDQSGFNPTTWSWTFTGGIPANSNQQNPQGIMYQDTGCYEVKLIVSNGNGSDSLVQSCYINVLPGIAPTVDFSASNTSVTVGNSINFNDLSSGGASLWSWYFEGGSPQTSTNQNPSNINYNTTGCFEVKLIASNSFGMDSLIKSCYVNVTQGGALPPTSQFTATSTSIIAGNSIDFIDLSGNSPTSWTWVFTNGSPSTSSDQNPSGIVYDVEGCFEVTLVASNANGSDSETKSCYIDVSAGVGIPEEFENSIFISNFSGRNEINSENTRFKVEVYSLTGQLLWQKNSFNYRIIVPQFQNVVLYFIKSEKDEYMTKPVFPY